MKGLADPDEMALQLYNDGRAAVEQRELGRAVELLEASVWVRPHFKTLEILGTTLAELGLRHRAVVYLAAAAGLAPSQTPARLALAKIFTDWDEPHDARVQLEEALRVNPQSRSAADLLSRLPPEDE